MEGYKEKAAVHELRSKLQQQQQQPQKTKKKKPWPAPWSSQLTSTDKKPFPKAGTPKAIGRMNSTTV